MNAMSVLTRTLRSSAVNPCRVTAFRLPPRWTAHRRGHGDAVPARALVAVVFGVEEGQRATGEHDQCDHHGLQGERLPGQRAGQQRLSPPGLNEMN